MKYFVESSTQSPRTNCKSRLELLAYTSAALLAYSIEVTACVTITCILETISDTHSTEVELG
jgi:hypothetical protein